MAKSGQLKAKVDRLEKKITAKGASLDAAKRRVLHKKLKRFQRAWRTALALEKRAAGKGQGGKPAAAQAAEEKPAAKAAEEKPPAKVAEEKPSGAPPEAATPAS
jgi:hypothetical protein